jgi:hypothetical protein
VHDLHVPAQLRAVVEAARAELAAEAHQLLVHHAQVFQEVAASFQRLLAEVALHRTFTVQAHVMSPAKCFFTLHFSLMVHFLLLTYFTSKDTKIFKIISDFQYCANNSSTKFELGGQFLASTKY